MIVGCPGAGKTTFANKLGLKLSIPVHHLDKHFWKENKKPTPQIDFIQKQNELMKEEKWILDGNFTKTIENRLTVADTIILFDFSKNIIIFRYFKRLITNFGKVRPDMGGNNRTFFNWKSFKFILNFPIKEIHSLLGKFKDSKDKKIIIFHNPKEVDEFLSKISPNT